MGSIIDVNGVAVLPLWEQPAEIKKRLDKLFSERKDKVVASIHIAGALGISKRTLEKWRQQDSIIIDNVIIEPERLKNRSKDELKAIRRELIQLYIDKGEQTIVDRATDPESKSAVTGAVKILETAYGYRKPDEVKVNAGSGWENLLNAYAKGKK